VKNVLEAMVAREYQELAPCVPGVCECATCREDVLVYALNRLPPRYVATLTGEVLSEMRLDADQGRADIAVALLEAFRVVGAAPRHPRGAALVPSPAPSP
jgi:competence protein ComFB